MSRPPTRACGTDSCLPSRYDALPLLLLLASCRFDVKLTSCVCVCIGCVGGDHHRCAAPVPHDEERRALVPGAQRQRQRHQEQVRQRLRLPSLAGRLDHARHRRHALGQGRRRVRLRSGRQGLRRVAPWSGCSRDRHRVRPDLRSAGLHAGYRGMRAPPPPPPPS
mgnify:CR=1 FL=1